MARGGYEKNLRHLKPNDEVKFVIASEEDYTWAREIILSRPNPHQRNSSLPRHLAKAMPGKFSGIHPRWLAERILEDRLPVRMQLQLHKYVLGRRRSRRLRLLSCDMLDISNVARYQYDRSSIPG